MRQADAAAIPGEPLALLDQWEPRIGAFVCTNVPDARAAAERSTERWRAGKPASPIDGMPVGIEAYRDGRHADRNGLAFFAGWRSRRMPRVRALRNAGAVIVGETVTAEFAATQPRGTRNPWNMEHTPRRIVERFGRLRGARNRQRRTRDPSHQLDGAASELRL